MTSPEHRGSSDCRSAYRAELSRILACCGTVNGDFRTAVRAIRAWRRLPAHQRRTPCEAAAHGFEQQQITTFDAAVSHRVGESQRDRRRRSIAVTIDRRDDLSRRDAELVG